MDFDTRYREHLRADDDAGAALAALRERVSDGEDVALVCFEADNKRFDFLPRLEPWDSSRG